MIKKCMGCGVVLQDKDKNLIGYTPLLTKTYCMRCFRLKNYGELKRNDTINEEEILKKVNKSKGTAFYLVDYLNINQYTVSIFNKLLVSKVFVVSKCDLLRKEMKVEKLKEWLREIYHITTDILFISKDKNISNNLLKYMENKNIKTAYILGVTNAGKSTFINSLLKENNIHKEILASSKENTTLDFIKLKIGDFIIYDTPGFLYPNLGNRELLQKEMKPITYQIKPNTTVVILKQLKCLFLEENQITIYLNTSDVKREYKIEDKDFKELTLGDNQDLVIPGVGFINIKKACTIKINFQPYEVRTDISDIEIGGKCNE